MKTKEQVEKEYLNRIDEYQNVIKAWRNVKRVTKKDGSDFSNIKKNFSNAYIKQEYAWSGNLTLSVNYQCRNGMYCHDNITIEKNDTVDSVFEKIEKQINIYDNSVKKLQKKAQNANRVFGEVDENMKQLLSFCENNGFSSYEICNYIHENCWR